MNLLLCPDPILMFVFLPHRQQTQRPAVGNRCDDSLPKSQTHGHPDLDLWLQVSYNHARALQVITELFCVASSTNAARVYVSW